MEHESVVLVIVMQHDEYSSEATLVPDSIITKFCGKSRIGSVGG